MEMEKTELAISRAIRPKTMDEAMKLAEYVSKSDIIPAEYRGKPGNCLIAIQYGEELGIGWVQALQVVCVINGKPSLYGSVGLALVNAHPATEWVKETWDEKTETATCEIKRKDREETIRWSFGVADAKKLKTYVKDKGMVPLIEKPGPWSAGDHKVMCTHRAFWRCARRAVPEALHGLYGREEIEDFVEAESLPTPVRQPARLGEVKPAPKAEGGGDTGNGSAETPPTPTESPAPAHAEAGPGGTITEPQRKRLFATLKGGGRTEADLKEHLGREYGITSTKEITRSMFEAVLQWAAGI